MTVERAMQLSTCESWLSETEKGRRGAASVRALTTYIALTKPSEVGVALPKESTGSRPSGGMARLKA